MLAKNNPRYFIYEPSRRIRQSYWLREPEYEVSDEDNSEPLGDFLTEFTYLTIDQSTEMLHKQSLHLAAFIDFLLEEEEVSENRIFLAGGKITLHYHVYLMKEAVKLLNTDKNEDPRLEWHAKQHRVIVPRAQAYWDMLTKHDKDVVLD